MGSYSESRTLNWGMFRVQLREDVDSSLWEAEDPVQVAKGLIQMSSFECSVRKTHCPSEQRAFETQIDEALVKIQSKKSEHRSFVEEGFGHHSSLVHQFLWNDLIA